VGNREINFRLQLPSDGQETPETASCDHCGSPFERTNARKRYCCEAHQRAAANARYRKRRTEQARCPNCETVFVRSTTSKRLQVYCSLRCQRLYRSASYKARPDMQASIRRARERGALMRVRPDSESKAGSRTLRWAAVEAANQAWRRSNPFHEHYRRIAARHGKNPAKSAIARKLLICSWHMLSRGQVFQSARSTTASASSSRFLAA